MVSKVQGGGLRGFRVQGGKTNFRKKFGETRWTFPFPNRKPFLFQSHHKANPFE